MNGDKVKALRKEAGLSQYRLAKVTRVSRFKISQYECGYGELSEAEAKAILDALALKGANQGGTQK